MTAPLSHIRVLDLSRILAGPWAGGVAALLVPTAQVALTAGRWGNLYTALAGASLLTLGLAFAADPATPHPYNLVKPITSKPAARPLCGFLFLAIFCLRTN